MLYSRPPAPFPRTPVKVALLTGLSDPSSCALSESQTALLTSLKLAEDWVVGRNFPWIADSPGVSPIPLWRASLSNARQFFRSRGRIYQETALPHLTNLADSCERGLILITGSCGAEILNRLFRPFLAGKLLHVIACGPVMSSPPQFPCTSIQGSADWISRAFVRRADVIIPGAGHMDYWNHPCVLASIGRLLESLVPAQKGMPPPAP